jgi:hypothetical protein
MKLLRTTFLFAALLSSIIACDSAEKNTTATVDSTETPLQEPALTEEQNDLKTLSGFWAALQIAVANKDKEAVKQLSKSGSGASSLVEEDYALLVAAIKVTDLKESNRQENGKTMYEYMMSMNYEDVAEENQPSTTIFIWRNETGNFEIFDLFESS